MASTSYDGIYFLKLSAESASGTPCHNARDMAVANLSINPETTEPSLVMTMNHSPGVPSAYLPNVIALVARDAEFMGDDFAFTR